MSRKKGEDSVLYLSNSLGWFHLVVCNEYYAKISKNISGSFFGGNGGFFVAGSGLGSSGRIATRNKWIK